MRVHAPRLVENLVAGGEQYQLVERAAINGDADLKDALGTPSLVYATRCGGYALMDVPEWYATHATCGTCKRIGRKRQPPFGDKVIYEARAPATPIGALS